MQAIDMKNRDDQAGDCCRTAEDGSTYCTVSADGQAGNCATVTKSEKLSSDQSNLGQTMRGWFMFALACLTSPCCTPLIVPVILAALAGTPVAAWLSHNLGWVYGALTLGSIISFVLALRWLNRPRPTATRVVRPADIPVISSEIRS